MAPGGSFLPLLLWLWPASLAQDIHLADLEDTKIAAPPHLTALIPAAVAATVAAGYTPEDSNQVVVATTEGTPVLVAVQGTTGGSGAPPWGKPSILIVGDTRYQWQEWSPWHCNCAQGSMSRVRDITYAVPGVVLDPEQYDVLRFQRVVCNYGVCHCSREEGQCDQLEVTCHEGEEHLCALRDIEHDQRQKRKDFWARLHAKLKNLWDSLQEAFPQRRKETTAKSTR